jgi:hypothetical protein
MVQISIYSTTPIRCCYLNEWLLEMDVYQHAKDGVHYSATLLVQGINARAAALGRVR